MRLLAIEVGQFGNYYNSRYQQIEDYGAELFVLSGKADEDHWAPERFFIAGSMLIEDLTELARELHNNFHFDGVLTFAENSVIAIALIAQALGLPGISPEAAVKSRNKLFMREAHSNGNAPHPDFSLADSLDEAFTAAQRIGYPIILKPTLGSASQFVYKIDTPEELAEAYPKARAGIKDMSQFINEGVTDLLGPNSMLVESYLDGREFLIEAFVYNGETVLGSVVDRVTLEGNAFDDDVHHAPTDLSTVQLQQVWEAVSAGARAQGLNNSVMHAEIRFHEGHPYIVEIAARPGGGGLDFMARISAGYCPIKAVMDIACGQRPKHTHYAATDKDTFALCLISGPGTIDSIRIPDAIRHDPAVFMLKMIAKKGSRIRRPPNGNDIIGFLGVSGSSRQETEEKAMAYSQQIIVRMS